MFLCHLSALIPSSYISWGAYSNMSCSKVLVCVGPSLLAMCDEKCSKFHIFKGSIWSQMVNANATYLINSWTNLLLRQQSELIGSKVSMLIGSKVSGVWLNRDGGGAKIGDKVENERILQWGSSYALYKVGVVTVPFPGAWGHKARISNWVARVCRKGKQVTVACCRLKQFQFFCSALNKENVLDAYPHHSLCLSKTVGCHNKKQRVFYFDASKRQQHVAMSKNRERERERERLQLKHLFSSVDWMLLLWHQKSISNCTASYDVERTKQTKIGLWCCLHKKHQTEKMSNSPPQSMCVFWNSWDKKKDNPAETQLLLVYQCIVAICFACVSDMGIVKIEATSECLVCLTYFGASFTYKLRVVVCLWYVMDNLESNDACCAQLWGVGLVLICSFEAFWKFHWRNSLSSLQCTYSMPHACACAKQLCRDLMMCAGITKTITVVLCCTMQRHILVMQSCGKVSEHVMYVANYLCNGTVGLPGTA